MRLPKESRFPGTEEKVSKVGDRVILEPLAKEHPRPIWDAIDALGGEPFMPEGRDQTRTAVDPAVLFDG